MEINFLIIAVAALVPLVIGFIWYNPKVFGNAWMAATGMTPEKGKEMNMVKVFSLTYLMSFFIAFLIQPMVIHQYGVFSVLMDEPGFNDPTSPMGIYFSDFMKNYGDNYRTFKHGVFHGVIVGLLFVTPIITINSLFEGKGFKYIAINGGYWTVCIAIM
nr:DUF1761 domain-containing protein [Burkholderiaceae bacterium]